MLKKTSISGKFFTVLILYAAIFLPACNNVFADITGAIFTTDVNCTDTINQFNSKIDVYLEGYDGLPDGNYDVQVTSPDGILLASSFGAEPVKITDGKFDTCYQLWAILKKASEQSEQGYDDTPDSNSLYKVWITQTYSPGQGNNGFIDEFCKTYNFVVIADNQCPASVICIQKFNDLNGNCIQDENEVCIPDWPIEITDPCGIVSEVSTPAEVPVFPGIWRICEKSQDSWQQRCVIVDGNPVDSNTNCAQIEISCQCEEKHTVLFGNIQLCSIKACKFIDKNVNGKNDCNEQPLEGIRFVLDGNDINGNHIQQEKTTCSDGCVIFDCLLQGSYTLSEIVPMNWKPTTKTCRQIQLCQGQNISFDFGNICIGKAVFSTKGYWHNKNGLAETTCNDIKYLNSLAPWKSCNSNTVPFGAIDGKYCSGSKVPAPNCAKKTVPAGTALAEQSAFLIHNNGAVKLQLIQQLDAFIMNVRHRLDGCGIKTVIKLPDKSWCSASKVICNAITVWGSGSAVINGKLYDRSKMINLLDYLNNSTAVIFVQCTPCEVMY